MRQATGVLASGLAAMLASPAVAQDSEPVPQPEDGRLVIDILAEQPSDPVAIERCEREADEAKIAGEIVVCRERRDQGPPAFNREDWERRYAERTQGPKTPDVDGSGIQLPSEGSLIAITVTVARFGGPGEAPLIIDVESLPEPPLGSDADRIARGLPPLENGDEGLEDITEDDLGLPPPNADAAAG
ncbi:MAG: hypothetical protein ACX930_12365 [Erythrobacter sp.]